MVINDALHPRVLEHLRQFKGEIFNPQTVAASTHPQEHRKASGKYGRVWMKQKGPKLFMWLVGGPAIWGSFLIWAAASDSIASKVALGVATVAGVGLLIVSVVRDRATMTLEELECFLPALDCQPLEKLYCETYISLHRTRALNEDQKDDLVKLLNELLDLDYSLADHEQSLNRFSAESIESQLRKIESQSSPELDAIRFQLNVRLEQAKAEEPAIDRIASIRALIETSLIGLRHDLCRSSRLTEASADPLNRVKELLEQVYDQARSVEEAREELESYVSGLSSPVTLKPNGHQQEGPSAVEQRGTVS